MTELTLEQKQAIAIASAKAKAAQGGQENADTGIPGLAGLVGGTRAALRGYTGGISDYVDAAARYGIDKFRDKPLYNSYNDAVKGERADVSSFRDTNPVAAYSNEIAGGVVSPLYKNASAVTNEGLAKASSMLGRQVPRYVGYGAQGATAGAVAGAGNAEGAGGGLPTAGDVAKSTGVGAGIGGILGVTLPATAEGATKLIEKTANAIRTQAPMMTQQQILTASQAAYKASEDAGVVIAPKSFKDFVTALPEQIKGLPKTPEAMSVSTPKSYGIMADLKAVAERGEPLTLQAVDELRSMASKASMSRDPHDAQVAGSIVRHIDDYIGGLDHTHLVESNVPAKDATDALESARALYRTQAKMRTISNIVDTGEMLNDQNWVKGRFRALVKSHGFGSYTDEEQKAIADVARTGNLEKVLKLIPLRGIQMASTYAEPLVQNSKINTLQDLIARGGSAPRPPLRPFIGRAPSLSGPLMSPFMSGGSNQ